MTLCCCFFSVPAQQARLGRLCIEELKTRLENAVSESIPLKVPYSTGYTVNVGPSNSRIRLRNYESHQFHTVHCILYSRVVDQCGSGTSSFASMRIRTQGEPNQTWSDFVITKIVEFLTWKI